MKAFEEWLTKQDDMVNPEDAWRAALEHILKMKISSGYCKTELYVLKDWIKAELEQ